MAFNLDVRFEEALAKDTSLPAFLRRPDARAGDLERRPEPARVAAAAIAVRGCASSRPRRRRSPTEVGVSIPGVKTPSLPKLGVAPELHQDTRTGSTRPATGRCRSQDLRGHVVLVDFWTYTCINCIRTLPFVKGLYATYHRYGLDVVGVETPEFTFEQDAGNVQQAIDSDGISYPVVQDNRYGTWNAYQNEYWPAEYYIDATRRGPPHQFGEGDYKQDEAAVRAAALRRRRPQPAAADDRARDRPLGRARDARDLPQPRARAGLRAAAEAGHQLLSRRDQTRI